MSIMALAQQLQNQGRNGDTILAHINPAEAQILEQHGGSGTINPETGLVEYSWLSDRWNEVKTWWKKDVQPVIRKLAPVIIPAVSIFFPAAIPAIGSWFGATGATAAVVGTAALSAGVTLASGGTLEQALKGAALGAAASYITPIIGAKANEFIGAQFSPAVQSYLGSAIVSGGIAAARGQSVKEIFKAAATGAATAYLGTLAKNYYQSINDKIETGKLNVTQKTADAALITAADAETYKNAEMSEAQIKAALQAQGVSDAHAALAAKSIVANNSAEQTAVILAEYAGKSGNAVMNATLGKDAIANSVTLGNNTDILLRAEDSKLMAEDAVALKNQGLTATQIQNHLEASGASTAYARTAAQMATSGSNATTIAAQIQTSAQYNSNNTSTDYAKGQVYSRTDYVVPRQVGEIMNDQQQALADSIPYRDMVTAGTITVDQAATYKDAGYAPADVTKLMSVGYNATDLQDLAAVGVNARDLVTLSNTKFAEGQINDLMAGGATVTDIATTSRVIDSGKIDVNTASQLLSRDIDSGTIDNLIKQGSARAVADSNLTGDTVKKLSGNGWDLNKAVSLQNSGTDVNKLISENQFAEYRNLVTAPTATTTATPTAPAAPVDPTAALVNSGTITAQEVSDLTQNGYSKTDISSLISKGYTAPDLMDLAAAGVPVNTLTSLANTQFPESQINDLMAAGASANDIATASNIVNNGKLSLDNATKLLSKDLTGSQINGLVYTRPQLVDSVANSNLNGSTIARLSDGGWDLNKAIQLSNSGTDVNALISENKWDDYRMISQAPAGTVPVKDAAGRVSYFEAATGNTLDASGRVITYARAPEVGGGTQTAGDVAVEVAGRPGKVGQESAVRGPLTPGNVLASDADIDAGRAVFNDAANAWETPERTPESEYTYTTPPGEVVGPPAPVPPANEYIYTTPPGEFVGPTQPPTTAPVPPQSTLTPTPLPPASSEILPQPTGPGSAVVTPQVPVDTSSTITTPQIVPVETPVSPPAVTVPGQTDDGTVVVTAPREPQPPLIPPVPGDSTPRPPVVNVDLTQPPPVNTGDGSAVVTPQRPIDTSSTITTPPTPTPAPVEVITPPTPYVPVPTPPVPEEPPKWSGWGPVDPLKFGDVGRVNNPGLNPGWVQPTPFYNTTSPVQSQYYWGQHPYQPGPTFNQDLYNNVPAAPAAPFGLQQMYTPTDLNQYLTQFTQQFGPVAPR